MRLLRLSLTLTALVLCALAYAGAAQPASGQTDASTALIRVEAPTSEARTTLVRLGLDVVDADLAGLTAWATPAQRAAIKAAGFTYAVLQPVQMQQAVDPAYHYYEGAAAELQRVAAQYPHITALTSIGETLGGRPIYALKISAQPAQAGQKPGVLIFALTHAREHLTTEMALYIIKLLVEGYGQDGALTNLINQREIWVLPNVNPDGCVFDVESGVYRLWRKNRRPNPDGSFGVDLNRNYGYQWGCCGGSSPAPGNELYRGPTPFSELETRALRDFVRGQPNLTVSLSLHTYSELVLWPFGYTQEALPADMDQTDHDAFVAIGESMARLNGYYAMQASGLYITDGGSDDWLYAERGIFAFTFEMYPKSSLPGFYPPGNVIERETRRNRAAVEYLLGIADRPRKVAGDGGDVTAPTITLTAPAGDAYIVGPLHLLAAAQDDVGVTLVEFLAGGQSIGLDSEPPYELTWDGNPQLGAVALQARAYDAGQNIGVSAPIIVRRSAVPVLRFPLFLHQFVLRQF